MINECIDGTRGINIGGKRMECIRFADDMVLLAENEDIVNKMLEDLNNKCEEYGMKINKKKTKSMVICKKKKRTKITLERSSIHKKR